MRRVLFGAFIIPLMMFAACEKANNDDVKPNEDNKPNEEIKPVVDEKLVAATTAMAEYITEGSEFNTEDIKWSVYWYLDAKMEYDDNFESVTKILSEIGGEPWQEELETVVCITEDMVQRFALLENNDLDVAQQGTLEFYPRLLTLFVDMEAQNGYDTVALEAKLLAYTDDYFVIEWQEGDVNLRALFKKTNSKMMVLKEAELKMGDLLESVSPLDKSRVEELITGKWVGSTMLRYDSADYTKITHVDKLSGKSDWSPFPPGLGGPYTFSADGTMTYSFEADYPPFDTVTYNYTWSYDSEKNILAVVDENGKKVSYSLLAVDDKWLIWDFEDVLFNDGEAQYIRQAFERK